CPPKEPIMPELLTPGVYIQEVDLGPSPIAGVSTSTAGFVGEAERGPDSGDPILVTSFADFQRSYGNFLAGKTLAYAVRGFFDNGGLRAFVSRVTGTGALQATGALTLGYDVVLLTGKAAGTGAFTVQVGSVVGVQSSDTVTFIDTAGNTIGTASVNSVNAV